MQTVEVLEKSSANELIEVCSAVAEAVQLREGAAGVTRVVRVLAGHRPLSTRDLSRHVELPIPVVSAICGELRSRGILERARPAMLSGKGLQLAADYAAIGALSGVCTACGGAGWMSLSSLDEVRERLSAFAVRRPEVDVALDQAHCTIDTALARAVALAEAGRLSGGPILFLGDDDLISIAVALLAKHLGLKDLPTLHILEIDERLIDFLGSAFQDLGVRGLIHQYDAREELPDRFRGVHSTVVTDPPYTVAGASLFVSRAVDALEVPASGEIFLSFGARAPVDALVLQTRLTGMGLFIRTIRRNFNRYDGAGTLGGVSHLYELVRAESRGAFVRGSYDLPLYTARPGRVRTYRCTACSQTVPVGVDAEVRTIADLKARGCPFCGCHRFRPLRLEADS